MHTLNGTRRRRIAIVAATCGVSLALASAGEAFAHARFLLGGTLKPRTSSTGEKTSPCGVAAPTNDPTKRVALKAGDQLTVQWEETIDHPGHYRIAFSPDGINGYDANVLKDNIADTQGAGTIPHQYSTTITIPTTLCETCSLQLIQFMSESGNYYYSCTDVRIVTELPAPTPVPTGTPTTAPGATPAPGSDTTASKPATPKGLKVKVQALTPGGDDATDK